MPQAHDVGGRFVTTMVYPPSIGLRDLPHVEKGAEVREVAEPYRIGHGVARRIPLTRRAVVIGRWADKGGEAEERIRAALKARDLSEEESQW